MAKTAYFQVIGLDMLQKKMVKRRRNLEQRRGLNKRVIVMIDRWIQKNFQSEGQLAHPGKGWKRLSPQTIIQRRQGRNVGLGVKILQDTGQLRSRWKHEYNDRRAVVQSGVPYSGKHHYGKGVPERRILPQYGQIRDDILKLYRHHVSVSIR